MTHGSVDDHEKIGLIILFISTGIFHFLAFALYFIETFIEDDKITNPKDKKEKRNQEDQNEAEI